MVVFGGVLGNTASCASDVWALVNANGSGGSSDWILLSPKGTAPGGRENHVAAYDPANNRMLVFGGDNCAGGLYNDVWILTNADGTGGTPAWSPLSTGNPPPLTSGARGFYDSASNSLVIFGGYQRSTGNAPVNDVYVLTNANGLGGTAVWAQLSPSGPLPTGRANHSVVYDSSANRMVIFGGIPAASPPLNDAWMLTNANGAGGTSSWAQIIPAGGPPPVRYEHTAVYDPATGRMVVFGGESLNDVWVLSNAATSPAITTSSLPAGAAGSAYAQSLSASGGVPPYKNWVVASGALPPWLSLDADSGAISGVPFSAAGSPFAFSVTVEDSAGNVSPPRALSIGIGQPAALTIVTSSPLPAGVVGAPYTQVFTAVSGIAPYRSWAITGGSSPPGTSLTTTTVDGAPAGLLSGTPTTAGTFAFTVQATDGANDTATKPFSLTINPAGTVTISLGGIVNAASYEGGGVAPGEVVTIFGSGLGPSALTSEQVSSGNVATSLGGAKVLFGGVAAPLVYVEAGQVAAVVPYEVAGGTSTQVQVVYQGRTSNTLTVPVAGAEPGIFTLDYSGSGAGTVLNQDGTVNSASNPAPIGSVVTVYATGEGQTNPPGVDGMLDGSPAPKPVQAVTATIGGVNANVQYAGGVPGAVAGILQVDLQAPATLTSGGAAAVVLNIGGATSQAGVTMWVEPGPDALAAALAAQMTQNEKFQLVQGTGLSYRGAAGYVPGIPRLGIPDLYLADGSVGVGNGVGPATALPSSIASAASWDTSEAYKYGSVIGAELRAYGINVNLGGNVNLIGREPRDGRTFETKGEDPILAGKITAAHINGVQDRHVIGGIKHFALNDQETGRTTANALIDERGMREGDLLAFEIGVKDSNVQSVMCAYNLVNSVYNCENAHLLNDILKGEWGFPGFVMSDWSATHSTVAAALAGLDQEQPLGEYFANLETYIAGGQVPQARFDDMVCRILRAMYAAGLFSYPESLGPIDTATDQVIAQEAEEQGAVLLKNAGGLLPLNAAAVKSIAVIGSHADVAVLSGGGSAQVTPTGGAAPVPSVTPKTPGWAKVIWYPSSPFDAIAAMAPGANVSFDPGTSATAAAALAAKSQVAIVFVSQWASEGMDVPSLNFTDLTNSSPVDQDALVAAVASANPHTIVVMENGGAQAMPWLNSVGAVLEAWYPGQRGGQAIANLLFGAVNPSGKLPITFPASVNDLPRPVIATPPSDGAPFPVEYSEGFNVGYKWYDSQGLTPLFPFGFGLSYTTFTFSNPNLVNNLASANPNFQVTFSLANTGSVAGAEVAQVYLALPAGTGEPPKRLVGWQKVVLQPGARQNVTIEVDANDSSHPLSYWDVASNSWAMADGDYVVYLGNSSSSASLDVVGTLHVGP
jgi:beta-glucosidase